MARRLYWQHLLPGLIILVTMAAIVVGVMTFARVGALHGSTVRLYSTASEARGVTRGSEVWLNGQKVGLLEEVRFLPATSDTAERVLLTLEVLEKALPQIRKDSYAQVRTGGRLVGANVVYITSGTISAAQLAEGDTIPAKAQGDAEELTSQATLVMRQLPEVARNLKRVSEAFDSTSGTLGAITSGDAAPRVAVLKGSVTRLTRQARAGRGTLGLAFGRGDALARARRAAAAVDSLRQLLAGGESSIGRFRRDSTLLRSIAEVRDELSIARALLAEPRGTAGRIVADSAIGLQLGVMERELGELITDVKRRPFRYIAF